MAHAGTMDLGGSAQTKQNGSPWPAIVLTLAVVVATIAGVWLASSAGLVGSTAKPADRSYDAIEAQRGVISSSGAQSSNAIVARRGVSPTSGLTYLITPPLRIVGHKSTLEGEAQNNVSQLPYSMPSGTFHPGTPAIGTGSIQQIRIVGSRANPAGEPSAQYNVTRLPYSLPSGTFHPGKDADDQLIAPVKRDRVGGP